MENILIVDDEVDICYFLKRNLDRKEYITTFVNTLKEASKLINTDRPNVVLLDNHLPDGLGLDFAEQVKINHPAIKIVMITAHDTPVDRFSARKIGVDYFVSKPFMMTEVYQAIDTVIKTA